MKSPEIVSLPNYFTHLNLMIVGISEVISVDKSGILLLKATLQQPLGGINRCSGSPELCLCRLFCSGMVHGNSADGHWLLSDVEGWG